MTEDVLNYGVLLGAREILAAFRAVDEWDAAPALFVGSHSNALTADELPEAVVDQARDIGEPAELHGVHVTFYPLHLPERLWSLGHPATVIDTMASAIADGRLDLPTVALPDHVDDERVMALLFVGEAWTLRGDEDDPEHGEMRFVLAVDTAGYTYWLTQPRGEDEVDETVTTGLDDDDLAAAAPLRRLLDALTDDVDDEDIA